MKLSCFFKGHDYTYIPRNADVDYKCSVCGMEVSTHESRDDKESWFVRVEVMEKVKFTFTLLLVLTLVIAGAMLLTGILYGFLTPIHYAICKQQAELLNAPFTYKFFGGCFVQVKGVWVSPDQAIILLR